LTELKRFDLQLEAIRQLQADPQTKDVHYVWAGEGNEHETLTKEVGRHNLAERIHFLGQRWDVAEWYDAADIFVMPSESEGMPLAIMEAMAKGLPVVSTAISGIPEELDDTGRLLPDPVVDPLGVVRGLVETITNWTTNPAVRIAEGRRCRVRAEKMFREDMMTQRTLELIGLALPTGPHIGERVSL
jgi:glycosyltransferase involved in cell wall biosynthesis